MRRERRAGGVRASALAGVRAPPAGRTFTYGGSGLTTPRSSPTPFVGSFFRLKLTLFVPKLASVNDRVPAPAVLAVSSISAAFPGSVT